MAPQSQSPTGCSVRSQPFLLTRSVHLEMMSVHPVVIVLIVVVVMTLQSQSPMSVGPSGEVPMLPTH
jgi:hypothetical protein